MTVTVTQTRNADRRVTGFTCFMRSVRDGIFSVIENEEQK